MTFLGLVIYGTVCATGGGLIGFYLGWRKGTLGLIGQMENLHGQLSEINKHPQNLRNINKH